MDKKTAITRFQSWMLDRRLARRTRESYLGHVHRYLSTRPTGRAEDAVTAWLSTFAASKKSPTTQRQALNAIVAFYRALDRPLVDLPAWTRPPEKHHIPTWVNESEAETLISLLPPPWNEIAAIMFGSGLRISEVLSLRTKDLDSHTSTITVRSGKGDKDRVTILPQSLIPPLADRVRRNRFHWQADRHAHRPGVYLPDAVANKSPRAGEAWPYFWLFPSASESTCPDTGIIRRHHLHPDAFSKALVKACQLGRINKRITAHSFRHGFATAYLMRGGIITDLRELLGHADIQTTQIYLHCIPQLATRATSPLDRIIPFRKTA
jgi:integrase